MTGSLECRFYKNDYGIANVAIMDNNTWVTGETTSVGFVVFAALNYINVTITNNKYIDLYSNFDRYNTRMQ